MFKAFVLSCLIILHVSQGEASGADSEEDQLTQSKEGIGSIGEPSDVGSVMIAGEVSVEDPVSREDASDDADGSVVRSKRYYGCGCFNCRCGTMMPATYAPCGGCCGCGYG
ncbi:unnamed protein product [Haemonchus placei]|uniref:Uncharacterized protein n=1 Tax=Haemonchus placei TaxID=6290 RepID=A0A0N4W9M3_HAEPC|nr:unnamed protein product [Haemonchus placei]